MQTIEVDVDDVKTLIKITTKIVKRGFTFACKRDGYKWVITFTGGY